MATMIVEVYDALRSAGADEEKARKAAEVMAAVDQKHHDVVVRFERLDGRFNTVTWMVGLNVTLTLLVLGKLFIVP
jgi:hypothetical protein